MLTSPFREYCPSIKTYVPFIEFIDAEVSPFLFDRIEEIDQLVKERGLTPGGFGHRVDDPDDLRGLPRLPDGAYDFHRLDTHIVDATLHVNDLLFLMYHRDNGFSQLTFRIPEFAMESLKRWPIRLGTTLRPTQLPPPMSQMVPIPLRGTKRGAAP
jgi:hypothetical protein